MASSVIQVSNSKIGHGLDRQSASFEETQVLYLLVLLCDNIIYSLIWYQIPYAISQKKYHMPVAFELLHSSSVYIYRKSEDVLYQFLSSQTCPLVSRSSYSSFVVKFSFVLSWEYIFCLHLLYCLAEVWYSFIVFSGSYEIWNLLGYYRTWILLMVDVGGDKLYIILLFMQFLN